MAFEPRFHVIPGRPNTPGGRQAAVVSASGDLDLASMDAFQAALLQATTDAAEVTVDLQAVTFCDSSTLRVLFGLATDIKLTLIVRTAGPVNTLLRISGLDRITTVDLVD